MKKKFYFFMIFLFANSFSFCQWQTIYQDSAHFEFCSMYFLNNDTGFVGGYQFNGTSSGILFRTFDGGMTWDTTHIPEMVMGIHFLNDSVGVCGGQDGFTHSTIDGGDTWDIRSFFSFSGDYTSIYFKSPTKVFRSTMDGVIQAANDTGATWTNVFSTFGGSYFPSTSRVVFTDSLNGYLAHSRFGQVPSPIKSISKTTDGGNIWADLNISATFFPHSCFFFDSLTGFAAGKFGKISKTTDGGTTWSSPDSIGSFSLNDIAFVNDSIGYIVGGLSIYDGVSQANAKGIIYQSSDGGVSWNVLDSSFYNCLTKLHFPSDSVGYAVGMNGNILKISNANSYLSIAELIINSKNKLVVYPNPTSTILNVEFINADVLSITNLLGEKILNKKITANYFRKMELDISLLSHGIYFLKCGNEVRKFVKQ